jgi:hypothetical protein
MQSGLSQNSNLHLLFQRFIADILGTPSIIEVVVLVKYYMQLCYLKQISSQGEELHQLAAKYLCDDTV